VVDLEAMDLTYVLLKKSVDDVRDDLEKPVVLDYYRDNKAWRVENKSYILLRNVSDVQEWLNIGGTYTLIESECAIDLMTSSLSDYNVLREVIRKTFRGQSLTYIPNKDPDVVVDYDVECVSVFLRVVKDVDDVLSEDMYIKLKDGSEGYVVYKGEDGRCYVFLGCGQFMLPIVMTMKDLSDFLKKQYRLTFELNMKVLKPMRS